MGDEDDNTSETPLSAGVVPGRLYRFHDEFADDDELDFDDIDRKKYKDLIERRGREERSWTLYEVEYIDVSERSESIEEPASEDAEMDGRPEDVDPFEEDGIQFYEDVSLDPCSVCEGSGISACETCNGTGEMDCPNSDCYDGKIRVRCECRNGLLDKSCTLCGGSGRVRRSKCSKCNGEGHPTHDVCNGTGRRIEGTCDVCSGEEPIEKSGIINCRDCDPPEHTSECDTCDASGETYQGVLKTIRYNTETETAVADDIPESQFEESEEYVHTEEYRSETLPLETGFSEQARGKQEYRIREKTLPGYDLHYTVDGMDFTSTIAGETVYGDLPKVKETFTGLGWLVALGFVGLYLYGYVYLAPINLLYATAWFWLGTPAMFVLFVLVSMLIPKTETVSVSKRAIDIDGNLTGTE